jgi:hypothetical protein
VPAPREMRQRHVAEIIDRALDLGADPVINRTRQTDPVTESSRLGWYSPPIRTRSRTSRMGDLLHSCRTTPRQSVRMPRLRGMHNCGDGRRVAMRDRPPLLSQLASCACLGADRGPRPASMFGAVSDDCANSPHPAGLALARRHRRTAAARPNSDTGGSV